jgi:hypothetical protein
MASITSWVRLEPRARDSDLLAGVEARLHDPLWLLARQWQLGELDGRNAGSAVTARVRGEAERIDAVRPSGGAWTPLDPDRTPLGALAMAPGRDEPRARPELARRARAGRQLARLLATDDQRALFVARFPFALSAAERAALDADDQRFLAALFGRVLDGDAAAAALRPLLAAGDLPGDFGLPAADVHAVSEICRAWLAWLDAAEHMTGAPAWRADQLAYAFDARAGGTVLQAPRHRGGAVVWHDVDARPGDGQPGAVPVPLVATQIPARVRYQGMPARRYWELEDAAVHWPSIDAGPGDVARLLFVEFGLTFADDWLHVPFEVPAGAVARIASLVVTDTFGVRTLVRAAADLDGPETPWRFLELSRADGVAGPLVFVVPAEGTELVGPSRQAVDFAADPVSRLVWGIERELLGADGRTREVTVPPPPDPLPGPPGLAYRVGPAVPDPFHPYRLRFGASGPELVRAEIPGRAPAGGRPDLPGALAVGATPARPIRLCTVWALTRSPDGSYHLGARREAVAAPSSAGLEILFDQLEARP